MPKLSIKASVSRAHPQLHRVMDGDAKEGPMHLRHALLTLLALFVAANTPRTYQLDVDASQVQAKVAFFAIASKTATFPHMVGSVTIVPDQPEQALIDVSLDATKLQAPDDVTLRRLKGEKFFWVEKYPTVRFVSANLIMHDELSGTVSGRLTARGVSRNEELHVTFDIPPESAPSGEAVTLSGEMEIDRRDYGMNSYRLIVGRKVKISFNARMIPQLVAEPEPKARASNVRSLPFSQNHHAHALI